MKPANYQQCVLQPECSLLQCTGYLENMDSKAGSAPESLATLMWWQLNDSLSHHSHSSVWVWISGCRQNTLHFPRIMHMGWAFTFYSQKWWNIHTGFAAPLASSNFLNYCNLCLWPCSDQPTQQTVLFLQIKQLKQWWQTNFWFFISNLPLLFPHCLQFTARLQ